jgi:hypothetical protein
MKRCTVLWVLGGAVAATLLAATLVCSQQPDASGVAPAGGGPAGQPGTPLPTDEPARTAAPPPGAGVPKAAPAPTIDDLLARLDSIKAQKAALEKAERETVATLVEKLRQQRERVRKLGVPLDEHDGKPAPVPTPAAGISY